MNFLEHRFTLDVRRDASKVCVRVRKGDTARRLRIALVQGVVPYEIRSDCYAVFSAVKPDGNRLLNSCAIEDNRIVYELTPQTTAVIGLVECEIRLYGADDALITSPGFDLIVDEVLYDENKAPQSETEVNALTGLISDAAEVIAEGRELIGEFGSALGQIEGVRDEAEAAAQTAVAAAESAETTAGEVAKQVRAAADAAEVARASADEAGEAAAAAVNAREAATTAAGNAAHSAEEAVAAAEQAKNYVQSIPEGGFDSNNTEDKVRITYHLTNVVNSYYAETLEKGENFGFRMSALDGYTITKAQLIHNGKVVDNQSYDTETTEVIVSYIADGGVQGDLVVIAVAEPISGSSQNGGFVAQPEPPDDTNLLWIDTDDETSDEPETEPGGYYTPTITQPDANTMLVAYTPSTEGMPSVEPVQVTLPAGPRGETGPAGPQGETGPAGANGKTPVRGTDYWTDADKQEMVNSVLAALPKWAGGSF